MDEQALETEVGTWMARARGGDRWAFQQIYARHRAAVVRFCTRMLGDPATGEEAAQETFVDLYRALDRYQHQGQFRSFLFTLAANRCRKQLRRARELPLPDGWDEADGGASPEEASMESELRAALGAALERLPERQRAALLLVQDQGMSYEQAAQALGASVAAVKTWIFRARAALKDVVEGFQ